MTRDNNNQYDFFSQDNIHINGLLEQVSAKQPRFEGIPDVHCIIPQATSDLD